ncbi:LTA synthase family protein [Aerolutibacter ruishenii]|uniref:Putative sulfatase n=1 Tax=Aerolutibacter ruishenii TaxID=686800 RepID=A0A562M122_9GAMM|nr:LTA synthase family protein [Lysobacter ruishenii]TWI13616.1 putative sulfatase [Lysobacter ruishenii]
MSHGGTARPRAQCIRQALASFAWLLPAVLLAFIVAHAIELAAGSRAAEGTGVLWLLGSALWSDLLVTVKCAPLLFVLSLPVLVLGRGGWRLVGVGLPWSVPVLAQAMLGEYFLTTRVPLGADLFGYSWGELRTTVVAGAEIGPRAVVALILPLAALWSGLFWFGRRVPATPRAVPGAALLVLGIFGIWTLPSRVDARHFHSEDSYNLSANKAGFLLDESLAYLRRRHAGPATPPAPAVTGGQERPGLDPDFPFLHGEQTPDTLGPLFATSPADPPPNLVFIVVEGLGRTFSGPGARLGSFTPFLDELATRSLYWENFLAVQGRTFAALPSIFGSLPFAEQGFAALEERMPSHATLLSVLKDNGYALAFYAGFDPDFDNERQFLLRQGVDRIVGPDQFGGRYRKANDWGFADGDLVDRVLEDAAGAAPAVTVIQTITLHTPYTFPGQAGYAERLERHLDVLGVVESRRAAYRSQRAIYESILYTDDALRRYFERMRERPEFANTVFVVTGDHRLPEIPMDTRIERYHVPLLVYSPRLKQPRHIRSVSSQFDIAPSLLAWLGSQHGIRTPTRVAWLGSGLDVEAGFRNVHAFPLKQTKGNLVDFISGHYFVNQGALYALRDGMEIEPVDDAEALQRINVEFDRFRAANDQLARGFALVPEDAPRTLSVFREQDRVALALPPPVGLAVERVVVPEAANADALEVEVVFANGAVTPSPPFVPLLVLADASGREVSETYGPAMVLAAGERASVRVPLKSSGVAAGAYSLAVIPSHPDTGKPVGAGKFRVALSLEK